MRMRLNGFRRLVARLGFWSLLQSLAASLLGTRGARAQTSPSPPRKAELNWDSEQRYLYGSTSFHDAIDAETRSKLSRGLPITIVLSALVYVLGQRDENGAAAARLSTFSVDRPEDPDVAGQADLGVGTEDFVLASTYQPPFLSTLALSAGGGLEITLKKQITVRLDARNWTLFDENKAANAQEYSGGLAIFF